MILRSPFPDIDIPEISLTSLVLQQATRLAEKPALIDGPTGRMITYSELATRVRRLAIGLTLRGFGKGNVLAIYSPNVPEYAIAVHGAIAAGGTVTTVNPMATARELAAQLNDSNAIYLATVPTLLPNALQAAEWSQVREVFVFGEGDDATPFDDLLAEDGPWPAVEIDPREDVAMMPYSSGTTGLPKGVMLTHYNLVANCYQVAGFDLVTEEDRIVAFLPFFHIYGIFVNLELALSVGATIITMPRFDLEEYLRLLQEYRSPRAYVVPPIVLALANHPVVDRYDLSSLRMVQSAAAPVSPDLCRSLSERLGCQVKQAYGMTELSPCSHAVSESNVRVGSGGVVVRNTESKIVDIESGEDLGSNRQGEIWVRGPQVMKGYLNRPEATHETITPDGWLRTGDIGYADEDGFFYIVDRLKELIKYKGYQVAPAELESVLLTHPEVADAAVIGSPDEESGEVPKAFVVRKGEISEAELIDFVAGHVAPYKKIRLLEFVEAVPKSGTGKILRRVLIERERERALAPV